jgi:hypothetical protein
MDQTSGVSKSKRNSNYYPSIYGLMLGLGSFFIYLIFYTVGRTPRTGDQPVARPLPTAETQNRLTQTSMLQVVFEPTIPVLERAKIIHTLYRAAIAIGSGYYYYFFFFLVAHTRRSLLPLRSIRLSFLSLLI